MRRPHSHVLNCSRCRSPERMRITPGTRREFRETEYRVRLSRGGHAVIRIGKALPRELQDLLESEQTPWGFITAWNPFARKAPRERNRLRQRELLGAMCEHEVILRAGVGVGRHAARDWREPSLFVVGLEFDVLDALAQRFDQAAIVRGRGFGVAELHEVA